MIPRVEPSSVPETTSTGTAAATHHSQERETRPANSPIREKTAAVLEGESLASHVQHRPSVRRNTPVREYMSRLPEEIDYREPLRSAQRLMNERHVRHIPVMNGVDLYGVLSRQDVQDAWLRYGETADEKAIGEVCTRDALTCDPLAKICDVADAMVQRGVTSALVMDAGVLVGIFTSTDALRVLAEA